MKKLNPTHFFCLLFVSLALFSVESRAGEKVELVDLKTFMPMLQPQNDTLYIVNFWATWCSPCVKELPHFEKIGKEYAGQKVKVILVSLDFADELQQRVQPFVEKRKLQSDVMLLDPGRGGEWIDQVDTRWSGAIPATLFINGSTQLRAFHEKSFTYEELSALVKSYTGEQQ